MSNEVVILIVQRFWQRPLIAYFRQQRQDNLPARASVIAHRRAGKDRASLFIELEAMLAHPCEVWHALPEYAQARKVIWSSLDEEGHRLIDVAFPPAIRKKTSEKEMMIELKNGAVWRLVGADNFNSLVGSNPRHVTFSEYALTQPKSWEFVRPILAANSGSALFVTTPRGYNHAYTQFEYAKAHPLEWYSAIHPVSETQLIPAHVLKLERDSMPDELYRQEWECSFSAANVGSILGSRVEQAEKQRRITKDCEYDPGMPVCVASDIGFRDAAAFWFWQPRPDGFAVIDYQEDSGLDADEWIERIRALPYTYDILWLPHDARAKTFATKRSAMERFIEAGFKVRITPQISTEHRINAARMIMQRCWFHPVACKRGLDVLRNWSFKWDDNRRVFSAEPLHDQYSHGGDAFSYFALIAKDGEVVKEPGKLPEVAMATFTLEQLYEDRATESYKDNY